jgi:hypothetical protein
MVELLAFRGIGVGGVGSKGALQDGLHKTSSL